MRESNSPIETEEPANAEDEEEHDEEYDEDAEEEDFDEAEDVVGAEYRVAPEEGSGLIYAQSFQLMSEDVWDDSALIKAYDHAIAEYQEQHNGRTKGSSASRKSAHRTDSGRKETSRAVSNAARSAAISVVADVSTRQPAVAFDGSTLKTDQKPELSNPPPDVKKEKRIEATMPTGANGSGLTPSQTPPPAADADGSTATQGQPWSNWDYYKYYNYYYGHLQTTATGGTYPSSWPYASDGAAHAQYAGHAVAAPSDGAATAVDGASTTAAVGKLSDRHQHDPTGDSGSGVGCACKCTGCDRRVHGASGSAPNLHRHRPQDAEPQGVACSGTFADEGYESTASNRDAEEQESMSRVMVAWYYAGYFAGQHQARFGKNPLSMPMQMPETRR